MSIGLKVNDKVPSGMLGTQQWYSRPEMQQLLRLEMEAMKPYVGEIKWGVNVGILSDGRMYWKVRQPIKAERANGRGTLYNNVYDIMLVYEPDHPNSKWGTSVHSYLKAPNDLTHMQNRANRSPYLKKDTKRTIPHTLPDKDGLLYLCTARYDQFGICYDDPRGVATAVTALLCSVKWLHNYECGLLSDEHWKKFLKEGEL